MKWLSQINKLWILTLKEIILRASCIIDGTQQTWDIYSIGDKSLCSKMNSINKDARKLCSAKRNAENVKGKKERSE